MSIAILARLLTPEEVGIYSLCAAVVAVASTIRDFGISDYLIQEKDLTRDRIRAAFSLALVVGWTLAVALFLCRDLLAAYYGREGIRTVIAVLALNFVITPFGSPAFALLTRELAFGPIYFIQTLSAIGGAATAVLLAWGGFSYMSLAWASVASTLVQILAIGVLKGQEIWTIPGLAGWTRIWSFGGMSVLASILNEVSRNWPEFVIGRAFGFHALGLFSRATGLINQVHTNVTGAALRVATPSFAGKHRAGDDLAGPYRHALAVYTGIAWPLLIFVAFAADGLIWVLLGSQWAEAVPLARILAIASSAYALWAFAPTLLTATGNMPRRVVAEIITAFLYMGTVTLGASYGLTGIAYGTVVATSLAFFVYTHQVYQVIGVSLRDSFRAVRASVALALSTAAPMAGVKTLDVAVLANPIASLLVVSLAGAGGWALGLAIIDHPLRPELARARDAVARKFRRQV